MVLLTQVLFIAPTDDIRIIPFPALLAVGAVGNNVGLIAMVAGIFVLIGVGPGIERDVLSQVRSRPLSGVFGLDA